MIQIGTVVIRPSDKREGRIVATKNLFSKDRLFQVQWDKGVRRWLNESKLVVKANA